MVLLVKIIKQIEIITSFLKYVTHTTYFIAAFLSTTVLYFLTISFGFSVWLISFFVLIIKVFSLLHGGFGLVTLLDDYVFSKSCNLLFVSILGLVLTKLLFILV